MSAKYRRVKQADLALPAPLRWLTRTFSSIRLAVVLLVLVSLYGTLASVPLAFLSKFVLLVAVGVMSFVPAAAAGVWLWRRHRPRVGLGLILAGLAAAVWACVEAGQWKYDSEFFLLNQAQVIYRLPAFEMTELEFYSWWPMRLILALFVVNMVWATIRRIEFKFVNLGVLTVHTGIVLIALGSIFYGQYKLEGDTIVFRDDLGGVAVRSFYDATEPALYVRRGPSRLMRPLPELPRYNDYDPGTVGQADGDLAIAVDDHEHFDTIVGPNLELRIPGFVAYGDLVERWLDAEAETGPGAKLWSEQPAGGPAIRVQTGDKQGPDPDGLKRLLVSEVPAKRVFETPALAVEYLVDPPASRLEDLAAEFRGLHGLIIELPEHDYRQVVGIEPGQVIQAGDTGFTFTVEEVGPYGLSFATEGYEGATDTRAQVLVERGDRRFRRLVMHRYPERSQDFLLPVPGQERDPGVGPMGRRVDPVDDVRLTYLDGSKLQFWLIDFSDPERDRQILARLPGGGALRARLADPKFPLGSTDAGERWLHITEKFEQAKKVLVPQPVPKRERKPEDEGTHVRALVPVDVTRTDPETGEATWSRRLWLAHMRYPQYPEGMHRPRRVDVPGVGVIELTFSRVRYPLPFTLKLTDFEMQPYPGSDIPEDYVAELELRPLDEMRRPVGEPNVGIAKLNDPLHFRGFKLSQAGWDPGEKGSPEHEARNAQGEFVNQQRYSIIGVGNNVGIQVIAAGSVLVVLGIPWAFYVKPWLIRRQSAKLRAQAEHRRREATANQTPTPSEPAGEPVGV